MVCDRHDVMLCHDVTLCCDVSYVMTLRLLLYVWPIGLFFQNALVDHIGVYTDTNDIDSVSTTGTQLVACARMSIRINNVYDILPSVSLNLYMKWTAEFVTIFGLILCVWCVIVCVRSSFHTNTYYLEHSKYIHIMLLLKLLASIRIQTRIFETCIKIIKHVFHLNWYKHIYYSYVHNMCTWYRYMCFY